MYSSIRLCRSCGSSKLTSILSLGEQYVSDFILEEGGTRAPLELVLCDPSLGGCGLVQLRHTVDREMLYRQYWYKSGVNETMVKHLTEIAGRAGQITGLQKGDVVIDIGCNDGTLLRAYKEAYGLDITTVGFEPAKNLVEEARVGTYWVINDFFKADHFTGHPRAKVITAIAMFYDLEDPNQFVADLAECLDETGVCIIQQNYLVSMLERNAYDNIGHEHLEYYSMMSLEPLLARHGLEVVDVELNDINGGSFRTYVFHKGRVKPTRAVEDLRQIERSMGLHRPEPYWDFSRKVSEIGKELHDFISKEVSRGRTVYVYGPGNRGNTILQFCNLDNRLIKAAAERNPAKWGRRTVGTNIPIVSEEDARRAKPDYFLILPWAFVDAFVEREKEYLESGGHFIVPLPSFHLRGGTA